MPAPFRQPSPHVVASGARRYRRRSVWPPLAAVVRGGVAAALAFILLGAPLQAQAGCSYVLGFATLASLVGRETVGQCLEDQRFNPANGNAEQQTTGGLLVWRKADNWT